MLNKLMARLLISLLLLMNLHNLPSVVALGQSKDKSSDTSTQKSEQSESVREKSSTTNQEDTAARKDETHLQRRAIELLPQLLEQAYGFEDQPRIRPLKQFLVHIQIADLLWNYDKPRAQQLLVEVFNAADSLRVDGLANDMRIRVRNEILSYLVKYDQPLAQKLAASVAGSAPSAQTVGKETLKEQATLYLQTAMGSIDSNPELAASLIKSSMNGWLSNKHLEALRAMQSRSPKLADQLFFHAMSLVPGNPDDLITKSGLLASYAFPDIEKRAYYKAFGQTHEGKLPAQNPELIVPFLEFVYNTFFQQPLDVLANESDESEMSPFAHHILPELLPYFDQHLPDKSLPLQKRIEEVVAEIKRTDRENTWNSLARRQATSLSGSAEEWVDKAEATNDPSEKNRYYLQAAGLLAMRDQDFDRALSFVSKISNERKRNETATFLGMMAVGAALKKGDIEKAQEYIKSIPGTLERAVMLTVLANEFVTRGDRKKAREFLNGAEQLLEQTGDSGNKLKVLILLAFEDYRQSHYFRVTLYSRAAFTTWAKLHFRE